MVGFTEPNQYEPRFQWRVTLEQWMNDPPADHTTWQYYIVRYWGLRIHGGYSVREAWRAVRMEPELAKAALDPSPDSGAVPPEVFSYVLARSRATKIKDGDNVDKVVIAPPAPGELPDTVEDGYSPTKYARPIYQPRSRWIQKLVNPPNNKLGWLIDLHFYWRRRTEDGMSVQEAWDDVDMTPDNAEIAILDVNADRGAIPPELIGRVVARAKKLDKEVPGIFLYPEPRG